MKTECLVCHHRCALEEGQTGFCRARKNEDGKIICSNYSMITSIALDPIEKKPLRKYHPGSKILSVGSWGCNMMCEFCQNYKISMTDGEHVRSAFIPYEELVQIAGDSKSEGNIGLAFTYNEPLIGYEYLLDCAHEAHKEDLKIIAVTNGCFTKETAEKVLPHVDALNIDLKSFNPDFYRRMKGDLETVKEFIRFANTTSHIELTTLIVNGLNDTKEEMEKLSSWVASVDKTIPLHVSRFFPMWKMADAEATPVEKVYELARTARKYLETVYTGNC